VPQRAPPQYVLGFTGAPPMNQHPITTGARDEPARRFERLGLFTQVQLDCRGPPRTADIG